MPAVMNGEAFRHFAVHTLTFVQQRINIQMVLTLPGAALARVKI